jgi:tRNA dimethylallyltransferase
VRILIVGPTAVGKTATSITLAERINAAIISADSRQCYKYMNIGTATPDPNELDRVPHYNISIFTPDQKDTASDFRERTRQWEEEILSHHEHVLYVGGSTLYLQSIIQPFDDVPSANPSNVQELKKRLEKKGVEPLYRKLQEVDPEYADQMDGMNPQRIIRALDVREQTGRPFSSFHTRSDDIEFPDETIVFGLHRPRKKLHERIHQRVKLMIQKGLVEEVQELLKMGYNHDIKTLKTVGYKEAVEYIKNRRDQDSMMEDMKIRTRQYAKKQITWFRRWDFIHWINADGRRSSDLAKEIEEKVAGL